jgi:hypothetical protein
MRYALGYLLVLAFAFRLVAAAKDFEIAPEPAWVIPTQTSYGSIRTNQNITEGEVFLLMDQQIDAAAKEYYRGCYESGNADARFYWTF